MTAYIGIGSCAIGGLCYYVYYNGCAFLNILKDVPQLEVGNDLPQKVEEAGGVLPYVAVSGMVSANGKTIVGLYNNEVEGVIHHISIKEHLSKWNTVNKDWDGNSRTISSKYHTEPFSLTNEALLSYVKVNICKALDSEELQLSTIYDKYEPIEAPSLTQGIFQLVSGEHVRGIQTIESMLFTNTRLTGVGELVLTKQGHLRLQPPSERGLNYILTRESIESIVKSRKEQVYLLKALAIFFVTIGGVCLSYWFYKQYISGYLENRRFQRLMKDLQNNGGGAEDEVCLVCMENPRDVVILPCGHVCSCRQCTTILEICPICRTRIDRIVPIFNS